MGDYGIMRVACLCVGFTPKFFGKVGPEQFGQGWGLVDQHVDDEGCVIEANQAGGGEFPRCHLGPAQQFGDVGHHMETEVLLFLHTKGGEG